MATVKAVKDPEADPKRGKPRATSGVRFPYNDLDEVIEVAKVVQDKAGGTCDLAQLATLLNYSGVSNGAFRTKVSAAKMFGLIEEADGQRVRVSARGRAIVAPISPETAARAKTEAFMAVDLFKKVFDRFNGSGLPEDIGLKNLLATEYQVVPDRITPTVRIMMDSADQAGLFKVAGNRSRMVMPFSGTVTPEKSAGQPASTVTENQPAKPGGGGNDGNGGGGDDGAGIDPAFLGMLRRLPPTGATLSTKRRESAINAFTAILELVYPDESDR